MSDKQLTKRTLSGFVWMTGSSSIRSVLQLVVTGILARLLSPEEFGIVAAAVVVILFTEMLYEMGVGPALVQVPDITDRHRHSAFTFSVGLGFVLVGLFYFLNPVIAGFYGMPELTKVLNVLMLVFPLKTFSQISFSLLQRDMSFKSLAGLNVVSYVVGYGLVGITTAFMGYGLWALVWANLAEAASYSLLLHFVSNNKYRIKIYRPELKQLLTFGSGFTLLSLLNFGARKMDYVIVGRYLGGAALGIYSRAYSLMNAPNQVVGTVMNKVLFSGFSKIQKEESRSRRVIERGYALLSLVVLPVSAVCYVLAPEIVRVLLGNAWDAVIAPFRILVMGMAFRVGYKIGGNYLKGTGRIMLTTMTQAIYLALITGSCYFLAPWGIEAVATGVTLSIMIHFLVVTFITIYHARMNVMGLLLAVLPAVLLTALLGGCSWAVTEELRAVTDNALLVLLGNGAVLLLATLLLLRVFPGIFLGPHGIWIRDELLAKFINRRGAVSGG